MDFILKKHPCTIALVAYLISVPIRIAGTIEGVPIMYFAADGLFVIGTVTAIVVLIRGRRPPSQASIYCQQCGKPCTSENELAEHALSHR